MNIWAFCFKKLADDFSCFHWNVSYIVYDIRKCFVHYLWYKEINVTPYMRAIFLNIFNLQARAMYYGVIDLFTMHTVLKKETFILEKRLKSICYETTLLNSWVGIGANEFGWKQITTREYSDATTPGQSVYTRCYSRYVLLQCLLNVKLLPKKELIIWNRKNLFVALCEEIYPLRLKNVGLLKAAQCQL